MYVCWARLKKDNGWKRVDLLVFWNKLASIKLNCQFKIQRKNNSLRIFMWCLPKLSLKSGSKLALRVRYQTKSEMSLGFLSKILSKPNIILVKVVLSYKLFFFNRLCWKLIAARIWKKEVTKLKRSWNVISTYPFTSKPMSLRTIWGCICHPFGEVCKVEKSVRVYKNNDVLNILVIATQNCSYFKPMGLTLLENYFHVKRLKIY